MDERIAATFWAQVDKNGPGGCWVWGGLVGSGRNHYGRFWLTGTRRSTGAHRWAYEALVGPIPEGLVIDHLCRNTLCVNPAHLEPVTSRENTHRGPRNIALRTATHCARGHEFTPENTYLRANGTRWCRECRRMRVRGRYLPEWRSRGREFACPACDVDPGQRCRTSTGESRFESHPARRELVQP